MSYGCKAATYCLDNCDQRIVISFGLACDETIKEYSLTGNKIAAIASVSPSMASRFKGGSAINADSLKNY